MTRALLTLFSLISVVFFPWPLTVFFALVSAGTEPLVPLAVGLFADTLYYAPSEGGWPFFTLVGAVTTGIALLVHSRLRSSIIRG